MSLWMKEGPESIITDIDFKQLPADLIEFLDSDPISAGWLDLFQHPKSFVWTYLFLNSSQWQTYYFQLHGHYLIYWDLLASMNKITSLPLTKSSHNSKTNIPIKGYINIYFVDVEELSKTNNLLISSADKQLKFKSSTNAPSLNSNASNINPSISDWLLQLRTCQRTLLPSISSSTCAPSPPPPPPPPPPQQQQQQQSLSSTHLVNRFKQHKENINSPLSPQNKSSSNSHALPTTTTEDDSSHHENRQEEGYKHPEVIKQLDTNSSNKDLPILLIKSMHFIGILDTDDNSMKLKTIIKRFIFSVVFVYLATAGLYVNGGFPEEGCLASTRYSQQNNGKLPCILYFSIYISSAIYYLICFICYCWMIQYYNDHHHHHDDDHDDDGDGEKDKKSNPNQSLKYLIKTHRGRMVNNVNRFVRYGFYYQCFMTILWFLSIFSYGPSLVSIHFNQDIYSWIIFSFTCFCYSFFVFYLFIPSLILTTIYYAESRRLRLILKDFINLLKHYKQTIHIQHPLPPSSFPKDTLISANSSMKDNVSSEAHHHHQHQQVPQVQQFVSINVISSAYIELNREFQETQARLGFIISLHAVGLLCQILGFFVISLYTFNANDSKKHLKSSNYFQWHTAVCGFLQFLPMCFIVFLTITAANKRAAHLKHECTSLLMNKSSSSSSSMYQHHHNNSHHGVDTCSSSGISSVGVNSASGISGGSAGDSPTANSPPPPPPPSEFSQSIMLMKENEDINRLIALIDRRPCYLKILGRRIIQQDVFYVCGILTAVQLINLFGIGWALPT